MNMNTIMLPLSEIATWERAKAGKEYPAGTILLQISATRGQLVFVEDGGKVKPSMYAAIVPDTAKVDPYYLYTILEMQMPEFLYQYQTGLNIQPDIFEISCASDSHRSGSAAEYCKPAKKAGRKNKRRRTHRDEITGFKSLVSEWSFCIESR